MASVFPLPDAPGAVVPSGNAAVVYTDIEGLLDAGITDNAQIASECNKDYRHFGAAFTDQVFELLADLDLRFIGRDTSPGSTDPNWRGPFDEYFRNLDTTTGTGGERQRKEQLKKDWERLMEWGAQAGKSFDLSDASPVVQGQQTNRRERYGYVVDFWNQLAQNIAVGNDVGNVTHAYSGTITDPAEINTLFQNLSSGGRRFGEVVAADIQAVKDEKAASDARWSTEQVTRECRDRSSAAIAAADAAYEAGQTDAEARAAYKNAWDTFVEPPLPYTR